MSTPVRERLRCRVAVTLEAPFLMRGIEGLGFGVDAAQLRDAHGRAVIPGDQLRGLLRQAVRDLTGAGSSFEIDVFGPPAKDQQGSTAETRGHLVVGDLSAACPATEEILPRVAIDGETGSAKSGHLVMVEAVAPIGRPVVFTGELVVLVEQGQAQSAVDKLTAALGLIPSIGAFQTAGFGRVVETVLDPVGQPEGLLPTPIRQRHGQRFAWSFGFDRPLLVAADKLEANVLAGTEVVPGAALKGALARRLRLAGKDTDQPPWDGIVSGLRIGHAFPRWQGVEHGRALPLSVVTDRDATLWRDELREAEASLLPNDSVPLFQPDWKSKALPSIRAKLGIGGGLKQLMRTRTAIDEVRGAADDGSLFSYRMIDPMDVRWRCEVDTAGLGGAELDLVLEILAAGLEGIGKTDAAMVEPALQPAAALPAPQPVPGTSDTFAVMLETPALILDTPDLASEATLVQAFKDYFDRASGGKVKLVRFFASESWAGGIVARGRSPYRPFVLVDAGSCFLLEGDPAPIAGWLKDGLPLPRWAVQEGLDWRTCRYLPENGFGAISVNRAAPVWGTA